ncbi:MAG: PfkB family carbohydrate kinase [Thermoguttaceae bacterium]
MSLVCMGSIGIDHITTPQASRRDALGGSAIYFACAASFFSPVKLVGVVGDDFSNADRAMLESRGIDLAGLEVVAGGKTFRWEGRYLENMNDRETLATHLNVLGDFHPKLPAAYRNADYVCLANSTPAVQLETLAQLEKPRFVVADTMDLWIRIARDELGQLLRKIDCLVLNDSEAKLLTGELNVVSAGRAILKMGPKNVVVKKGEHGAMFFSERELFVIPACPTDRVIDPTGAGDSFAGGMMGYLASVGKMDAASIKTALAYGAIMGSFAVEGFSLERFAEITRKEIDARLEYLRTISSL